MDDGAYDARGRKKRSSVARNTKKNVCGKRSENDKRADTTNNNSPLSLPSDKSTRRARPAVSPKFSSISPSQSKQVQPRSKIHPKDPLPKPETDDANDKLERSRAKELNEISAKSNRTYSDLFKFSSRNSLRTSTKTPQSSEQNTTDSKESPTDDEMSQARKSQLEIAKLSSMEDLGLGDPSKYLRLTSDIFVRQNGQFLYCLLCGKRTAVNENFSCERHLDNHLHQERFWALIELLLKNPPHETSLHMRTLYSLVGSWLYKNSLKDDMVDARNNVIRDFQSLLAEVTQDCDCLVIGSYAYGTSLATSDINLELVHPNSFLFESDPRAKNSIHHKLTDPDAGYGEQFNLHTLHYDMIPNALDTLYKLRHAIMENFTKNKSFDVVSEIGDLNSKMPKLGLIHKYYNLKVEISCYADSSRRLAKLLGAYLSLDERAKYLSILVKYWAKQCHISTPPGTFSSEIYVIFVIYYLQRTNPPILPCLHEIYSPKSNDQKNDPPSKNQASDQFVNRFERLLLSNKGSQRISNTTLEHKNDPDASVFRIPDMIPDHNNFNDQPSEKEADEQDDEEDEGQVIDFDIESVAELNWKSSNEQQLHSLFIEFLQFMVKELDDRSSVITIRTLQSIDLRTKRWNTQLKPIEHPLKPKTNMTRVIGSTRIYNYIRDCFLCAYHYLSCIPLDSKLRPIRVQDRDPRYLVEHFVDSERLEFYFNMKETMMNSKSANLLQEMVKQNLFARDVEVIENLVIRYLKDNKNPSYIPQTLANQYDISKMLPPGVNNLIFCWLCRGHNHVKSSCPKTKFQQIDTQDVSRCMSLDMRVNLDAYFSLMHRRDAITPHISSTHRSILHRLQTIINSESSIQCELTLYGSTVNNLGSQDSDLDICLTLVGNRTGNGVNCLKTLKEVLKVIKVLDEVEDIEPVFTARVPILKFKYFRYHIDLSMYNQCAIHNSRLLKTYSEIDPRVSQLFYLVKRYAKCCGIADASKGTLSSYAWSLMVIHFLQRTSPPILPVLQEYPKEGKQMIGVNGWNVWFNDDVSSIKMDGYNHMNLTQLFKEFFLYYHFFDFNIRVVTIRTRSMLTRFQKNWTSCMMAIEDPFELTYNLASRLDDMMAAYVIDSFGSTYNHIVRFQGQALSWQVPKDIRSFEEAFFNGEAITNYRLPPYRGCRHCHRIGHRFADCPTKSKATKRSVRQDFIERRHELTEGHKTAADFITA